MSDKVYLPLLNVEKVLPILNKIALFGGLSDKQLYTIFRLLESVEYEKGEEVFHEGDEPSHIYIVRAGEVRLVADIDTEPLEIALFCEGDCFGETSVIGILPQSASAVATMDSELIVLSSEALYSIFETDKELFSVLMMNIAREVCRRLDKTDEVFQHYVHSAEGRG